MACKNICRLCRNIRISQSLTVLAGTLIVNLPAGGYNDDETYCLVIAQNIPSTATVSAPIVITIGTGAQQYPLVNPDGTQVTAGNLRTRTRYKTICETSATSAVFRCCSRVCCGNSNLASVNGTAVVVTTEGTEDETT